MTTSGSDTVDERIAWGLTRPVRKNSGEANTESSSTISDDDTWYTQLSNLDGYIDDDEANQKLIAFGSGVHRKCTFYGSVSIPSSGGGVDCETTDDDDGDAKYYFYYYWDYDDDQESGKGDDDDDYNYYSTKRRLGGKQDDDGEPFPKMLAIYSRALFLVLRIFLGTLLFFTGFTDSGKEVVHSGRENPLYFTR